MLTKEKRRRVFYLLVILFLIISPVIVAYAMGYTIDFSRGSISKVGGIFVKSARGELSIYINNEFQKKTSLLSSGALLTGLRPESYNLRIEKEGFKPWVKNVKVESGMVAEIRDVLMAPDPIIMTSASSEELAVFNKAAERNKSYRLTKNGDLLDLRHATSTPQAIATNIVFFDTVDNNVFIVNRQGFLAKFDQATNSLNTLERLGFFIDNRLFKFASHGDYLFVIDSAGGGYLLEKDQLIETISSEILEGYFDREGTKLLLVRKNGLGLVWLSDNPRQPFQKKGAKEKILSGKDYFLKDAQWLFTTDQHVIVQTEKNILLTSIKKDQDNPVVLISGVVDTIRTFPEFPDNVFIKKKGVVYKVEL